MITFLPSQLSEQGLRILPTLVRAWGIRIELIQSRVQSLLKSWGGLVSILVFLDSISRLSPANEDVVISFIRVNQVIFLVESESCVEAACLER